MRVTLPGLDKAKLQYKALPLSDEGLLTAARAGKSQTELLEMDMAQQMIADAQSELDNAKQEESQAQSIFDEASTRDAKGMMDKAKKKKATMSAQAQLKRNTELAGRAQEALEHTTVEVGPRAASLEELGLSAEDLVMLRSMVQVRRQNVAVP